MAEASILDRPNARGAIAAYLTEEMCWWRSIITMPDRNASTPVLLHASAEHRVSRELVEAAG